MVKEPDMKNPQFLGDTYNMNHDMEAERERVESLRHQTQLGAKVRANSKQIGGEHYKNMGVEPWHVIDTSCD